MTDEKGILENFMKAVNESSLNDASAPQSTIIALTPQDVSVTIAEQEFPHEHILDYRDSSITGSQRQTDFYLAVKDFLDGKGTPILSAWQESRSGYERLIKSADDLDFDWNCPASYNVGFINRDGNYEETQLDVEEDKSEFTETWKSIWEELGAKSEDSVTYVELDEGATRELIAKAEEEKEAMEL